MPTVFVAVLLGAVGFAALLCDAGCGGWRASTPVCMAGSKLDRMDRCRSQRAPRHRIPFRAGVETKVMQAYHGYRTHKEDLAFSIDYKCEPGTPIVASRSGVVWSRRGDSNKGCDDPSCVEDGNYVVLDHGDGSFSEYHHLQQFGALVDVGEQVCAGEVIGLCGNTGYSSGPHLHFAVTDVTHRTVPTRLPDSTNRSFPFVVPDKVYTSENEPDYTCSEVTPSTLPKDAFAQHGIILDRPISIVPDGGPSPEPLEGWYFGPHPKIAVHRKPVDSGEWVDECVPVREDGRFSARLHWPDDPPGDGYYWFMVTAADEKCQAPGWAWSYKVRVE